MMSRCVTRTTIEAFNKIVVAFESGEFVEERREIRDFFVVRSTNSFPKIRWIFILDEGRGGRNFPTFSTDRS